MDWLLYTRESCSKHRTWILFTFLSCFPLLTVTNQLWHSALNCNFFSAHSFVSHFSLFLPFFGWQYSNDIDWNRSSMCHNGAQCFTPKKKSENCFGAWKLHTWMQHSLVTLLLPDVTIRILSYQKSCLSSFHFFTCSFSLLIHNVPALLFYPITLLSRSITF